MGILDKIRGFFVKQEGQEKVRPVVYRTRLAPDGMYYCFRISGKWRHRVKRRFKVKHGDKLLAKAQIEAGSAEQNGKPVTKVVEWSGELLIAKGGNGVWRLIPETTKEDDAVLREMIGKPATLHILQKVINADEGV